MADSTIAWAADGAGWIAVAPVLERLTDGSVLVGASVAALGARSGDGSVGSWRGELVLRDGRRWPIGGQQGCLAVAVDGMLVLAGDRLSAVAEEQLRAARVELRCDSPG